MAKKTQKFVASFVLGALLVVVGGFCYGLSAKAEMDRAYEIAVSNVENGCGGLNDEVAVVEKSMPFDSNNLLPCCVDRHDNLPSTEIANFSGITKIAAIGALDASELEISFVENKLKTSSDSSPPKPDKLSSVLRLE